MIHPVVADTGRTRLLTTYRDRLPGIGAGAIAAQGRRAEAEAMFADLVETKKRVLGDTYSLTVETRHEVARLTEPA
jgi:hypothetical protein